MKLKWLIFSPIVFANSLILAQTPWPTIQAANYPVIKGMTLVRHEQSVLFGEADQQTGLFFAKLNQAYSEQVQSQLISDAQQKGWRLHTVMRYGTQYVLTFHKSFRLLDVRLANAPEGVEAVYSIALNQQTPILASQSRSVANSTTASAIEPASANTPEPTDR